MSRSHNGEPAAGGEPESGLSPPTQDEVEEQIGRDILAIHLDSYDRGAATVAAHVLGDVVVVILDRLELLPSEEFLIEQGRDDAVGTVREGFQQAIAPTFKAAVERATGRRVVSFSSQLQIGEPRFAVEVFRLGSS